MDELDQLREIFGEDADRVYRGMQYLNAEVSMSSALEVVLRVMDKDRRSEPFDELELRVQQAMTQVDVSTDSSWALLGEDVQTSLRRFLAGTRVEIVDTLSDGRILVSVGISETVFPVAREGLVDDPQSERDRNY